MNFLAPTAFWFAAAIPVVILFYLLKRKRVLRLVSSTVLWQKFLAETQASAPFQRLRHNWLLVLQILLLVLAILALARPFFAGKVTGGRLQVVILDASASMQCTDEKPTRFDAARQEALRLVDGLRDTDQMIVLLAAGSAEVKQSATSDKAILRRALHACAPADATTRLTEALKMAESLTRDQADAEIHLISDGAAAGLKELQNKGLRLVYHRIGQRSDNLGIISLDVRTSPEDPTQRALFASIANNSPLDRQTEVELAFDDQLIETRSVRLPAGQATPLVFLVAQSRDGVLSVRLTAEDDLAADNRASIISQLPKPVKVLLVGGDNRFLAKALRAAGAVELFQVPALTDDAAAYDVVVLDGALPAAWPQPNVLAIRTVNTNWFEIAGEVQAPTIVDWKGTHPLLRFVNPDNVQIAKAVAVQAPSWALSLVESSQTPLVLAGEIGRQRVVWVGFDFLESNWPLRISFPIFIANAVNWLNPAAIRAERLLVSAGEPLHLPLNEPASSARVVLPDQETREIPIDPGAREVVCGDTARQGVYRMTVGTNETWFAVNLLDSAESDTEPRAELDFGKFGNVTATATRRASLELWRWIAAAGLLVLLFEWWFYHKRTA